MLNAQQSAAYAGPAATRRRFLSHLGGGFGSLALAHLLAETPLSAAPAPGGWHLPPKARRVIFLFMRGGPSHLDLFDPKPAIGKYEKQRPATVDLRTERVTGGLMPSPFQFTPCGQSGLEISELLPHLRDCADDLCIIRSMYGVNPNHAPAGNYLISGRIDQIHPSLGAWVAYGLGSENENLPGFVSLTANPRPSRYVRNGYLPGEFQGTPIDVSQPAPESMVKHLRNTTFDRDSQLRQLKFIRQLNATHHRERASDADLEARIRLMETAFRMQFAAGEALELQDETEATRQMYGEGHFANACLLARRLAERGVRFIHLEHGNWDHHNDINKLIPKNAAEIDQPIAALLKDLKQRGLLDETLVVWGGEFGRTPVSEAANGRDHNHYGFTVWLAGGGVRGGVAHGATDEFGFRAVENRVSAHDLHATLLHLLGIDHERLTWRHSGRDFRLTDVHGHVIREIIA